MAQLAAAFDEVPGCVSIKPYMSFKLADLRSIRGRAGRTVLRIATASATPLVLGVLCLASPVRANDAKNDRKPAPISDAAALQTEADSIEKAFTNVLGKLDSQKDTKSSRASGVMWLIVGGGLLGLVVMARYIPGLLELRDASFRARVAASKAAVQVMPGMEAEEKAFSAFAASFSSGLAKVLGENVGSSAQLSEMGKKAGVADRQAKLSPVKLSPAVITDASKGDKGGPMSPLRRIVEELSDVTNPAVKDDLLRRAVQEAQALKTRSESPECALVWKTAATLEALLNQLVAKPRSVSQSTLRTATAALDLIEELSESPTRPDLAERPPIRVLAVDDDPISRHAISFTLKKALALPELASNGVSGLELATHNAYDAIFLDIQMPEMNGFDLCLKIRQTELNRNTPIVFITCQSDFSVRSRSSVVGGQDLIAKPFLTFEVALKALTLVIQNRLRNEPVSKPEVSEAPAEELAAVS
jgi:CheY-like chemotaxis protein